MFNKIALLSVPVSDQEKAKAFYIGILGCTLVEEMPFGSPGVLWIRLRLLGTETDIVLATWFPQMKPGCLQGVVLTTKDIVSTHAKLKKRGLLISEIEKQPWAQEATFSDPDGNGWVLQQTTA